MKAKDHERNAKRLILNWGGGYAGFRFIRAPTTPPRSAQNKHPTLRGARNCTYNLCDIFPGVLFLDLHGLHGLDPNIKKVAIHAHKH